jgi:hypothetical protein
MLISLPAWQLDFLMKKLPRENARFPTIAVQCKGNKDQSPISLILGYWLSAIGYRLFASAPAIRVSAGYSRQRRLFARPLGARTWSLANSKAEPWLRRSQIFIVIATKIAISSVGAASNRAPQAGKETFLRAAR